MLIQHYKNNTLINTCTILTMESLERVGGGGGESPCCSLAAARGSWPPSLRFSLRILLSCAILFFVLVGRGILVVLTTVYCRRSHCHNTIRRHYHNTIRRHYHVRCLECRVSSNWYTHLSPSPSFLFPRYCCHIVSSKKAKQSLGYSK